MSSFQERLKDLRGQTSQAKFAEMIGVPQTTLGRYERGESQPDVEFASHVCLALGINPNWLLLGIGPIRQEHQPETAAKKTPAASETLVCADCELIMVPMVEARLSAGSD
jgi:transcriptional regulator with XRE-family HTH domain